MNGRHPGATLLGSLTAGVLVELASVALFLAVWAALVGPWVPLQVVAVGAAFGAGWGLALGLAELAARARGLGVGLFVLAVAWPLPCVAAAALSAGFGPEAVASMPRTGVFLLLVNAPLLAARVRGADLPAQAGAAALGGGLWLIGATLQPDRWADGAWLPLWAVLVLLLARVVLTPLALDVADRGAGPVLRFVRGVRRNDDLAVEVPRAVAWGRWKALGAGATLALVAVALLGAKTGRESAELTVRRFNAALRGPEQGFELAAALAGRSGVLRSTWAAEVPLHGPVGALDLVPSPTPADRSTDVLRAYEVLAALSAAGHARSTEVLLFARVGTNPAVPREALPELDALLEHARAAAKADDPVARRVLAEVLLARREAGADEEAVKVLEQAVAGGDVPAMLALARRRPPTERATMDLLRRALSEADRPELKAEAAAELERRYEEEPGLRSSTDELDLLRVQDGDGKPLDGAVALQLDAPRWAGEWETATTLRVLRREVHGGALVPGLLEHCRPTRVVYSRDLARIRANIIDGEGRFDAERGVVTVASRPADEYGVVRGLVQDSKGKPVGGRRVQLVLEPVQLPSGKDKVVLAGLVDISDEKGWFSFPDVPRGQYQVGIVDGDGWVRVETLERVMPGGNAPSLVLPADLEVLEQIGRE